MGWTSGFLKITETSCAKQGIDYLLSIKQVIFFSLLLLVIKLFFSASNIVKLIHDWELTFRILSCHFFFCLFNPLQKFKLKLK